MNIQSEGKYLLLGGVHDGQVVEIMGILPQLITKAVLVEGKVVRHERYEKIVMSIEGDIQRFYRSIDDPATKDLTNEQLTEKLLQKFVLIAQLGL